MKTTAVIVALGAILISTQASAACRWTFVDGIQRQICDNAIDLPAIRPPAIAPILPPSVRPIERLVLPPIGTTSCHQAEDWNGSVIESRVAEEFNGFDGETVVILENGQIWKQTDITFAFHFAYRPKALLYNSSSGWKILVDGIKRAVAVERLK